MNAFYRLNLPIATPVLSPSNAWLSASLLISAFKISAFAHNNNPYGMIELLVQALM